MKTNETKTTPVAASMTLIEYMAYCLKGLDATQVETFHMVTWTGHGRGSAGSDRVTVRVQA